MSAFHPKSHGPRRIFHGSWKCSDCGKEITELPFEPTLGRPVYCQECWAKRRPKKFKV